MVKEIVIGKGAAGLRRSAIAERIRLHEEWSSLKGTDNETPPAAKVKKSQPQVFSRNLQNVIEKNLTQKGQSLKITFQKDKENRVLPRESSLEVLRGVVALVDIGSGNKAFALRAALTALGATVVLTWSPLVTHLVWAQGGCRSIRAKARGLACNVVSPLWVEACAASGRRISEKVFPSTARASDLPSPATLCRLLKRAEKENWQLSQLLLDSDELRPARLRISSDTDNSSKDKTNDGDTTRESIDAETRVNTAPRRALPLSISPLPANPKSRRKLFTARAEADEDETDAEDSPTKVVNAKTRPENPLKRPEKAPFRHEKSPRRPKKSPKIPERQKTKRYNLTQEQNKNLEKAGRLAKRLAEEQAVNRRIPQTQRQRRRISSTPRIVLTGMPKSQHRVVLAAIQALHGKVQKHVNHRTTHVLLGRCKEDTNLNGGVEIIQTEQENTKETPRKHNLSMKRPKVAKTVSVCNQCNSPRSVLIQELENDNVIVSDMCSQAIVVDENVTLMCSSHNCDANKDTNAVRSDNNAIRSVDAISSDDNAIRSDINTVRSADNALRRGNNTIRSADNVVRSDDHTVRSADIAVRSDNNTVRSADNAVRRDNTTVRSDDNAVRSDNNNVRKDKSAVTSDDVVVISDDNHNNDQNHNVSDVCEGIVNDKSLRTLKTLLGAARGCRVLHAQWALESQKENQWLPHIGYEVTHLLKICRKARIERSALDKMHKEYAYDVFRGMRVSVSDTAHQREAAVELLLLCGAEIIDPSQNAQGYTQNGVETQNGGTQLGADFSDVVVRIGKHNDEVSSKWVFDSVAAGRPRTTRRYVNRNIPA